MGQGSSKAVAPQKYSVEAVPSSNPNESGIYRSACKPDSLFDGFNGYSSCWDLFADTVKKYPDSPALGSRPSKNGTLGDYEYKTWGQVMTEVTNFSCGILALKALPEVTFDDETVQKTFRFVGVTGKNRQEYYMTMQASYRAGACLVPLYDTLGADVFEYIINQTKMALCVAGEKKLVDQLVGLHSKCPSLKVVISMDEVDASAKKQASTNGITLVSFSEVCELGAKNVVPPTPATSAQEVNTICYTSGTTGNPKGAFVVHQQLLAAVAALTHLNDYEGRSIVHDDLHISYLPYAHIFERAVAETITSVGACTAFYGGDTLKLIDDIKACKPTVFFSVPRLYTRIFDKIKSGVDSGSGLKKALFNCGYESKLSKLRETGDPTHSFWDKLIFSKTKEALGGRVRFCLTGAAPLSKEVQEFLKICFCCPLIEGYGMTETVCVGGMTGTRDPVCGTVGGVVPGVEMKVIGIPEMNYGPKDKDENGNIVPRGELCFRGPCVFRGYFQNPEKTAEAMDADGWIHTGDVAKILPNGSMQIFDRAKNIFKLSQGEYIAPEKVENVYVQAASVGQCWVHGVSTERYIVAVVVPSEESAKAYAAKKGVEFDMAALCKDEEFKKQIHDDIKSIGKQNKLNGMEIVKEICLYPEAFSVENDLLTATFKLKRHTAKQIFKKEIDAMYAKINA